jgi:hypothetical protein
MLAQLAVLMRSPDPGLAHGFPAMVAAVEAAFRQEEALLERLGEACLHPRRADHAVLLCALHRTAARVEAGDLAIGRLVAAALDAVLRLPLPSALPAVLQPRRPMRHAR